MPVHPGIHLSLQVWSRCLPSLEGLVKLRSFHFQKCAYSLPKMLLLSGSLLYLANSQLIHCLRTSPHRLSELGHVVQSSLNILYFFYHNIHHILLQFIVSLPCYRVK